MNTRLTIASVAAAIAVVLLFVLPAKAYVCTVTDFTASGTLTADKFNTRFGQVKACFNSVPTFPLSVANLANKNAVVSQAWSINGDDDGVPGDGITAKTGVRQWRVPVTSNIIGVSARLSGCAACSVTITFKANAVTYKAFSNIAVTTTQSDFSLATSVTNAQDLTIDISGTFTSVNTIDIVVYETAQLQP